jgi:hypothetical protein
VNEHCGHHDWLRFPQLIASGQQDYSLSSRVTGKPASEEPLCGCLPTGSVGQPPVELDLASIPAACLATGQQVQVACQATFDAAQNYFNLQAGVAQWPMHMVALLAYYIRKIDMQGKANVHNYGVG